MNKFVPISLEKTGGEGTPSDVESILDDDEKEEATLLSHLTKISQNSKLNTLRDSPIKIKIVVLGLLFISVFTAGIVILRRFGKHTWIPCGTTAAEARAANCHYEPMMRAWIPHACYFPEPSEEYDPFHDREWFSDENLTVPVDMRKLEEGVENYPVYSRHFHQEHCLYAWRKLAIAVERKLPLLDSKSHDVWHSSHCSKMTVEMLKASWNGTWEDLWGEKSTRSPTLFLGCKEMR
ncbi:hypothetical protein NA57DRAFT_71155 [Rhizodiscina lignyota]|uniref:Uncharacterized protein n=1 Tax=Rhizodiscina lignyota TaxID=1504668 RepID=A0A9P4IVB4_9PEZI|nr:hypothetical protein NA57DRAFT_71155 [Rhizodiscina lignyota]